jgi:hypothetical protein
MALEAFGRLGPTVCEVATRALAVMQPLLQQVAGQIAERRRHGIERQYEQERAARASRGHSLGR